MRALYNIVCVVSVQNVMRVHVLGYIFPPAGAWYLEERDDRTNQRYVGPSCLGRNTQVSEVDWVFFKYCRIWNAFTSWPAGIGNVASTPCSNLYLANGKWNYCVFMYRDREGSTSNQSVVHGVISSFVDVERYKKKARLKVHVNEC